MNRYVVLDIETTGLFYELWDEPIEVCAIRYDNGKTEIYHEYIHPYKKVPKKVEEITKITNLFLEKKRNKYAVLPELREFIGDDVVIGHNVSAFDVPFLNFWFYTLDLPLITKCFCTMKTFKTFTGKKHGKLCDALDYYGIVNNQAHSAIEDTRATMRLFQELEQNFPVVIEEKTELEAYEDIMKRVCKSAPHKKIKEVLCNASIPSKADNPTTMTKDDVIAAFRRGATPYNVYEQSDWDYESILNVFYQWLNAINASKFYRYFSDDYLYSFVKKMVKRVNSISELRDLHKKIYQTEDINLFVYMIIYKLEKDRDIMEYSVSDFDYYFSRGTMVSKIAKNTGIKYDIVKKYFILWAEQNKKEKKDVIRNYIVGKSDLIRALKNGANNEKESLTVALYKENFFSVSL